MCARTICDTYYASPCDLGSAAYRENWAGERVEGRWKGTLPHHYLSPSFAGDDVFGSELVVSGWGPTPGELDLAKSTTELPAQHRTRVQDPGPWHVPAGPESWTVSCLYTHDHCQTTTVPLVRYVDSHWAARRSNVTYVT